MTFVIVVWLLGMTVFAIGIALLVNKENFGFLPLLSFFGKGFPIFLTISIKIPLQY